MEIESVETPSVETPVVETPNENPEVPVTPAEPTVETPVAEEKFKLPDGQEVTSQQLYDLHVNKLLPDYTRKSQKLAEYEHINKPKEEVPACQMCLRQFYLPVLHLYRHQRLPILLQMHLLSILLMP